jgi:pimeloyl-ACP methyl ester carboxylesterase
MGQRLLFLHANGYPPLCYKPLLEALAACYQPIAMLLRPLWSEADPERVGSWNTFSNDLLQFICERNLAPVMAVGHSLGAIIALRATLEAPELFDALVLVDPVLYPGRVMMSWSLTRTLGLAYRLHPMIRGALSRRTVFRSPDEVFARYRRHAIFRYLSDEHLRACIAGLTTLQADGSVRLVYSPEWEARVYYTAIWNDWDIWRNISTLDVPTLIIRGDQSDTFWKSTAKAVVSQNPRIDVATVRAASHLVALERPDAVASLAIDFLQRSRLDLDGVSTH